MDAIELLKAQHRDAEALFERIRRAEGKERVGLCIKLAEDLTVHAELEERIFYPEAVARGQDALIERSVHEHLEVREQLGLLLELNVGDPRLLETVARIEFLLKKHIEEEERVLFPQLAAHEPNERMETLRAQMARTEEELRGMDLLELAEARM